MEDNFVNFKIIKVIFGALNIFIDFWKQQHVVKILFLLSQPEKSPGHSNANQRFPV